MFIDYSISLCLSVKQDSSLCIDLGLPRGLNRNLFGKHPFLNESQDNSKMYKFTLQKCLENQ